MAAQSSGRPLNALVVESDPDYAVSVRAIAEAASLGVTVTPEPEEGLRLLASERFDLVVLAVREQDDVAALVGENSRHFPVRCRDLGRSARDRARGL